MDFCLEVAFDWRKSTHSGDEGGDCAEVTACPHAVRVRDFEVVDGPQLALTTRAWHASRRESFDSAMTL